MIYLTKFSMRTGTENDIVNGNMYRFGYAEGTYRNILKEAWTRWSVDNPNGTYPRLGYSSNLFAAAMDR